MGAQIVSPMNSVFLSPHFPPNFYHFAVHLKGCGAKVFGIADEAYENLNPALQASLTEYYRVSDMHNYDELVRALGYFTHKYGKLDHLDSHSEYWLETEARLRSDFNIPGLKLDEIDRIKRKSQMKKVFEEAGLKPARGRVCRNKQEVLSFIEEVGYPVVAKPNVGVGAAKTFKLTDAESLEYYLKEKLPQTYIVEEFIDAPIVTFDGLVDIEGNVIFSSTLQYDKGVMEIVNEETDMYYYLTEEIDPRLERAGFITLRAFDVSARFFHFEFFMTPEGEVIPLEVNMRPPGGLTVDMWNYLFDFDCYRTWAEMIVNDIARPVETRGNCIIYVSRKDRIQYALTHAEVVDRFKDLLVLEERISPIFAPALGDQGYILRGKQVKILTDAAQVIQKRA